MSKNSSDTESAHDSHDEGSQIDHEDSDPGSESEESEAQGFLDDMAEEGDDTEQSDEEDDAGDYDDDVTPSYSFPQFTRLPPELRRRIWELFCPELTAPALTLDFNLTEFCGTTTRFWHLSDGITLYDSTKATRAVLAVHQESRAMALNRFPDPIDIQASDADAIIRFHPDKDVPVINNLRYVIGLESPDECRLPACFGTLKHVAIGEWEFKDGFYPGVLHVLVQKLGSLKSLFLCLSSSSIQKKELVWCTSEMIHRHYAEAAEGGPYGVPEILQYLYCWPNLESHIDFARFQVPKGFADSVSSVDARVLQDKGIDTWPMVVFEYAKGMRRYESLDSTLLMNGSETESSDDSDDEEESEESGTDLDQYESDGIDDREIEHLDPDEDDEISIDGDAEENSSVARFSSPEPDPDSEPVNRTRKRRIVEDSEDEEDEDQPAAKRSRTTVVVSSDTEDQDEDEDEPPTQSDRRGRAARVVMSDSESDDEDEGSNTKAVKADKTDENNSGESESEGSEESESEDESEEESESEDEENSPPRMSLAERLRLARRDNPVESDDEASEDDLDGDSEDEEEDESEDDRRRGGASMFFDGMAEEEDEDEDEDEVGVDDFYDDSLL